MKQKYYIEMMLLLVVLLWAGNYTYGKFGMREFSPLVFTAVRFLIATPLLLALLKYKEGRLDFPRKNIARVIATGVVGIAVYQTVFIAAVKYASVTNASLALGMSPIFTALLGAALGQERLNSTALAGCLTAFGGLFLVVEFSPAQTGLLVHSLYGDGLALTAAFLWGLYPIVATPLLKNHSALWLTSHSALAGTVILLTLALPELTAMNWARVSPLAWSSLLYTTICALALAAWYHGMEKIGANQVMIYMYLITPVAIVIAMLTIGETVTPLQGLGALITICGIILTKRALTKDTTA